MKNAIEIVGNRLEAGVNPSVDEWEAALEQAMRERSAYRTVMQEMGQYLNSIVLPYMNRDPAGVTAALEAFIAKQVKIAGQGGAAVH
ncbi:MAG: hypothetical protein K2P84_02785 [Undibacterium sp.]|nr:hypothetical protein [Undibacterium sp.]